MIIADDEYCEDCGSSADVEVDGILLCNSCAAVYRDEDSFDDYLSSDDQDDWCETFGRTEGQGA